jgi:hypothetical protein
MGYLKCGQYGLVARFACTDRRVITVFTKTIIKVIMSAHIISDQM